MRIEVRTGASIYQKGSNDGQIELDREYVHILILIKYTVHILKKYTQQ